MSFRHTNFPYMLRNEPETLKRDIIKAFESTGCKAPDAAEALGVTLRIWYGYVNSLGLLDELQEMRRVYRMGPKKAQRRDSVLKNMALSKPPKRPPVHTPAKDAPLPHALKQKLEKAAAKEEKKKEDGKEEGATTATLPGVSSYYFS